MAAAAVKKGPTLADRIAELRAAKGKVCKVCSLPNVSEVNEELQKGARYTEIAAALELGGISISDDMIAKHFKKGHDKAR
jgi:hypothetical protein